MTKQKTKRQLEIEKIHIHLTNNIQKLTPTDELCELIDPNWPNLNDDKRLALCIKVWNMIYQLRKIILLEDKVIFSKKDEGYKITSIVENKQTEFKKRILLLLRYTASALNYSKFQVSEEVISNARLDLMAQLRAELDLWVEENLVNADFKELYAKEPWLLKICEDCGKEGENVMNTFCPYQEEIYEKKVYVRICPDCFKERQMDI